jgi:DNA polymerase-3 subunit chi
MSEVAFHFNASDKVAYACRLLRKAYVKGASLFVLAAPGDEKRLDAALWTMAQDAFIPHCLSTDPELVKSRSRIEIGVVLPASPSAQVLVNLQGQWVEGWAQFEKVVEVVSLDETDRLDARERWRRYRADGVAPVRHDLKVAAT